MVRSPEQNRGFGRILLGTLLDYAKTRGINRVSGDVASTNQPMLDMALALGFVRQAREDTARTQVFRGFE